MSQGFLITCTPTKSKQGAAAPVIKTRLLKHTWSATNFIKSHIKPGDDNPLVTVQCFNSYGYPDRILVGEEAVKEFVTDWGEN